GRRSTAGAWRSEEGGFGCPGRWVPVEELPSTIGIRLLRHHGVGRVGTVRRLRTSREAAAIATFCPRRRRFRPPRLLQGRCD
ncbi:hypothetical protein, partial [Methanoculleus sp. UBA291]